MCMKNKKAIIIVAIVLFLLISGFVGYKALKFVMEKYHYLRDKISEIDDVVTKNISHYDFDYSWVNDYEYVAHAFGGKGSKTYTNSLEAFEYNYDLGHRVFEVDFDLSTDGVTICSHDEDYWRYITGNENSDVEYSYANFKNTPLFNDYTPLDYKGVIDLLIKYPDIYIVTDTKYDDELSVYKQLGQLCAYGESKDASVLDRIVPQIYNKDMLDYVMNVHDFRSVIFTLYNIVWDKDDIAKYCMRSGVKFITVSEGVIDSDIIAMWKAMGIRVAVHTVNEADEADDFFNKGVDLIYTDFLQPEAKEDIIEVENE